MSELLGARAVNETLSSHEGLEEFVALSHLQTGTKVEVRLVADVQGTLHEITEFGFERGILTEVTQVGKRLYRSLLPLNKADDDQEPGSEYYNLGLFPIDTFTFESQPETTFLFVGRRVLK